MKLPLLNSVAAFVVAVSLVASTAQAATIPLFNTGVDGSGNVMAEGALDTHYATNVPLTVRTTVPISWLAPGGASQWIVPPNEDAATYIITQGFDLSGFDLSTVVIEGRWSSDNEADLLLNNAIVSSTTSTNYGEWQLFSINSGFFSSANLFTFDLTNEGGPVGLRVEFTRATGEPQSTSSVPDSGSTMWLMTLALGGVVLVRARSRAVAAN